MNGAGTITINSNTIQLTAVDGIILKSQRGNVSAIGPYVNTMGTAGASGAVTVGTITIDAGTGGNLVLSSVAPNSGDPLTAAFVGPVSCTGTLPLDRRRICHEYAEREHRKRFAASNRQHRKLEQHLHSYSRRHGSR